MLVAIVMIALSAFVLYQSRQDAAEYTRINLRNIALIAERDIERNFALYQLSLQTLIERLRQPRIMTLPLAVRRQVLFDRMATAGSLGTVLVVDRSGRVLLDSDDATPDQVSVASQKYFIVQRDDPHAGFYISDPYSSPLRFGTPSIALSKRISESDGSFGGIVVLVISLDYFRALFGVLSLGPHGSVSLIGKDGVTIMRQPLGNGILGKDISQSHTFRRFISAPEGSFSEIASIDGVRRLYWFKNFPGLPLIIMVAAAERDMYALWRTRAITIGSLMCIFGAVFIALSFSLAAQLRRRIQAEDELRLIARTDVLTGLNNRRTLDEILAKEWSTVKRNGSEFSLLFVDLDRFKAYNDTYGHQAGDDALASVARCIAHSIRRPRDTAARYGGEEFVVVLPDTNASGAQAVAEKISAAVNALNIAHVGSEHGCVTVSIGATSCRPDEDDDVASVVRAADAALYEAKAHGRNRVATVEKLHG
ncbi:sensor domain-containing diguanylate cyclase [Paraburkholderia sp. MM5384-R2]|uniref:sensor domain-containing diguanylate cyclase n=1 Tax=Paraburkholderia sp. MM5384-R2 TaxID=2723097 RepID=UPI0021A5C42E|nr:sensor domain-containing diguanylate cyclase [Paraburkholderia sp. MM5384-R2]